MKYIQFSKKYPLLTCMVDTSFKVGVPILCFKLLEKYLLGYKPVSASLFTKRIGIHQRLLAPPCAQLKLNNMLWK